MSERIRNGYANIVAILAVIGCLITFWGLDSAMSPINWSRIIVVLLYLASFFGLISYTFSDDLKSKSFFRIMTSSFAGVVVLSGILFAPVLTNLYFTKAAMLFSIISLVCLIMAHNSWRDYKFCRNLFTTMALCEILCAALYCYVICSSHESDLKNEIMVCSMSCIRPLIAVGIAFCYVGRMKVKFAEGKK